MKKVFYALLAVITLTLASCMARQKTTAVVRPVFHKTYPKNQYRIDIPVGARHIRFLGRRKLKVVRMQ